MEKKKDAPTPRIVTHARAQTIRSGPVWLKIKGRAPATVVAVVARSRGNWEPRAPVGLSRYSGDRRASTTRTDAFTAIPLTATKAHRTVKLKGLPCRVRRIAGRPREGGTADRMTRGADRDSMAPAITIKQKRRATKKVPPTAAAPSASCMAWGSNCTE
jgi:hypothetical protein